MQWILIMFHPTIQLEWFEIILADLESLKINHVTQQF